MSKCPIREELVEVAMAVDKNREDATVVQCSRMSKKMNDAARESNEYSAERRLAFSTKQLPRWSLTFPDT